MSFATNEMKETLFCIDSVDSCCTVPRGCLMSVARIAVDLIIPSTSTSDSCILVLILAHDNEANDFITVKVQCSDTVANFFAEKHALTAADSGCVLKIRQLFCENSFNYSMNDGRTELPRGFHSICGLFTNERQSGHRSRR